MADQPHRGFRQVVTHEQDDQGRQRAESQRDAPHEFVVDVGEEEHRDDGQRQHLADREHELPAVAHDLALPLGHRFHDVGVAVGDIAAERHAEQEPHDDEPAHAGHESLEQRQGDEQHHRGQEHDAAADLVRQPPAEQRPDQGSALRAGRREAEQQRVGMVLVLDEDQHEGDRIEVPGFDQDRGQHEPADPVALRVVIRHEVPDGTVHDRFLRHRQRHADLPWFVGSGAVFQRHADRRKEPGNTGACQGDAPSTYRATVASADSETVTA